MTKFLLPPSETKNDASGKVKLNLKSMSFPELAGPREELLEILIDFSEKSPTKARSVLGLSQKQDFERVRNINLRTVATGPAWQIYSGVLFDALSARSLSAAAIKKLTTNVYVQSALFGLISMGDRIPAYRLSADTKLPRVGTLSNIWANPCAQILNELDELIVDLRSSQYAKLAPIPKEIADQVVVPKILQKMPSGPPKVVSHHNKATKGRIIRQVVTGGKVPESIEQLAKAISKLGADVEIVRPKKLTQSTTLNVIVKAL